MNSKNSDYAIQPLSFTNVTIGDKFWKRRIDTAIKVTIPYDFEKCEETGRIDNFAKAGGLMDGPHQGIFYNDSDVFKVVQGAAYGLHSAPNPKLEAYLDDLIDKFAAAQEEDGYLYTARTIDPKNAPEHCGPERWSNLGVNHELYNVGHMYEAAVAYYEATGKRKFLDVALKNADLIDSVFGVDKLRDVPGHQEIEIGLAALYRATGEDRYLRLAKFFLDERGRANGRDVYGPNCQDHLPVTEQREAVGHAVRAGYMYAGMTDIAALTGDGQYAAAVKALWENVVGKKLALTGGIGARHDGEAFGDNYELPNLTAYNETCAAQANILWNQRLFQLTGEAKYIDILERALYNGFLSGIGMDGRSFFYVNPLACDGKYPFNLGTSMTRQPWYQTSCCPTNVVRLLPSLPSYIYARRDRDIFVNLYAAGNGRFRVKDSDVRIQQVTDYPWDGDIVLQVSVSKPITFNLKLRVPGYARHQPLPSDLYRFAKTSFDDAYLSMDGMIIPYLLEDGYISLEREWRSASQILLRLPLLPRRIIAHNAVDDLRGKVALERGPILYALEAADNEADVLDLSLPDASAIKAEHKADLLGGVTTLSGDALDALGNTVEFSAIPYYAWGHRGEGQMTVWLNRS
ncbi:MAG: glycoside hydrolase family 127 protein [Chloroflexi bacterium]|nr:glycoside hydrolase family 127 protein [Chloroflexota bacterium]